MQRSKPRRFIVRLVRVAAVVVLLWILVTAVFALSVQNALVFPRSFALAQGGVLEGPPADAERVWVTSTGDQPGMRVEAWLFVGKGRSAQSPGPAVMIFHGNAMLIDFCVDWARHYSSMGVSAMVCEFRGYGRSEGDPTQDRIQSDMVQFRDLLDERPEVDPARVVYHGRSLGGAVAAALAVERPPAAMILECTFTSMSAMFWRSFVPGFLATNPYATVRTLPEFKGPILLLHGERDDIVPASHARALHKACPGSELRVLKGGHNDFPEDRAERGAIILDFLTRHGLLR